MVSGILLAAGAGTRFGGPKLLRPLPDGTPLALAALRALASALPRVVAVVRPGDDKLAQFLAAEGAIVTVCRDAHLGMGTSLAWGVGMSAVLAQAGSTAQASGWVVALADMPFVRPQTVAAVVRLLGSGAALAAPVYRGVRGHPVGFSARFYQELVALSGDQGARALLAANEQALALVDCDDPGVLFDIDKPEDWERVCRILR